MKEQKIASFADLKVLNEWLEQMNKEGWVVNPEGIRVSATVERREGEAYTRQYYTVLIEREKEK